MINDSSEKLNNMATLSKYTHHSSTKISCFSTAQSLQNGSDEAAALLPPEGLPLQQERLKLNSKLSSKGRLNLNQRQRQFQDQQMLPYLMRVLYLRLLHHLAQQQ